MLRLIQALGPVWEILKSLTYFFCLIAVAENWNWQFSDFRREVGEGHPDQGVLWPWGWCWLHSLWTKVMKIFVQFLQALITKKSYISLNNSKNSFTQYYPNSFHTAHITSNGLIRQFQNSSVNSFTQYLLQSVIFF